MTITAKSTKPHPMRVATIQKLAPFLAAPTIAVWDEEPRLYRDKNNEPWLLLPAEDDPMRTLKGEVAIPKRCLVDLQRIAEHGVEFDRLAIAHELRPTVIPADVMNVLDSNGVRCTHDVARKLVGTIAPPPTAGRRMASALDKTVNAITKSTAALADAAVATAAATTTLDPIVFGVIGEDGPPTIGRPAHWFALTAWRW